MRTAVHIIVILSVGLIASLPLVSNCGLSAYDFVFHLVASQGFAHELWHGTPYPRWLGEMNAGFGSPTFFFYAPVPYYLNSIFEPTAHFTGNVCLPLALSAVLAMVASGWTAYFWLRGTTSATSATIGAIIYMLLPYHLSIDLYVRFAYAEFWAFVWMPLALLFARRVALESPCGVVGLAISGSLLAFTHLPTFLVFFPVPIIYAIVLAPTLGKTKLLLRLAVSTLLMAGLSAIYWVPAIRTQDWVSMNEMNTAKLFYGNNFLTLPVSDMSSLLNLAKSLVSGRSDQVGPSVVLPLLAIFLSTMIAVSDYERRARREAFILALIGIGSIFMMFDSSRFIWEMLPPLQRIQFPTRFQSVLALCLSGLSAFAVNSIQSTFRTPFAQAWNKRWQALTFLFSTAVLLIVQFGLLNNRNWQGEGAFLIGLVRYTAATGLLIVFLTTIPTFRRLTLRRTIVILFWVFILLLVSRQDYEQIFSLRFNPVTSAYVQGRINAAPEHFPRWIPPENRRPASLQAWSSRTPKVRVVGADGSAQVKRWRSRLVHIQTDLPTSSSVEVAQFYYPGWAARIHPGGERLEVNPSDEGLLQVVVPKGQHDVQLALYEIPSEKVGILISAVSAFALLLLLIRCGRSNSVTTRPTNTTA
jgi:hypothetical protein